MQMRSSKTTDLNGNKYINIINFGWRGDASKLLVKEITINI